MESTHKQTNTHPFRVLSLDGGGMRGLYTCSLLEHLSNQLYNKEKGMPDIGKGFDLIVGTSTGGILACGLAFGLTISQITVLYKKYGLEIFVDPMPDGWKRYVWALRNLKKAPNNHLVLRKALEELFDKQTVNQVYSRRQIALCISSVKMLRETARVFKTGHNPEKTMDDNLKIVDVCMATSAAPIFLPLAEVRSDDNKDGEIEGVYSDGGLWANNPVLIGLLEALSMTETSRKIEILSLGTCGAPSGTHILSNQLNRGLFDWGMGTQALSVSMNAQASGANYMVKFLKTELGRLGKSVHIIRVPQGPVSADQIKLLQMDLASEAARKLFVELGQADATEVLRSCQTPMSEDGKIIRDIFINLPVATIQIEGNANV